MTEYFAQIQTTGKLFLMKGAMWLKMLGITIQDISQIKKDTSKNYTKPSTIKEKLKNMVSVFSKIKLDNFMTTNPKLIFMYCYKLEIRC